MQIADPATFGMDAGRLAAIDGFLDQRYVQSGRFKGTQLLVSRDGQPVHFSSAGSMRESQPVGADTLFRIASMTKPVTSVAFMMLVEEGKVALDDPVHRIIPEWKGLGVYDGGGGSAPFVTRPTAAPMRMVDLLRHTAGLTYSFQNRGNIDAAYRETKIENWYGEHDLDSVVRTLAAIPLEFSPGEAWNYSVATDILGLIIQRIEGKPLDRVFRDRIFAPLGMEDTFFQVPADKVHRLADCYTMHPEKGAVMYDKGAESAWSRKPTQFSGGGGLVSTAADYHRFCAMLLNKGELHGTRLLSPKTIELMTINHLPGGSDLASMSRSLFSEATNAGVGFGLGFAVTINLAPTLVHGSVGEYYWGGMFSTAFHIDPVERLIFIFMTQLSPSNTYPVRRELKTMIYSAITESRR
ncbi:beta-lactamase family protein [Sphingomonas sp. ID1715]|uniref:serine hydrolase domain-containing protein n=1 Tax=Sphingomonas sp. ID1715 TaxID=1656898 RepID=UPI0014885B77|nr:serine hydrolase domain-containing protein [Sphingomonas sp. ID1715]NNM77509.1 beta-lactamase family protein [Sphingomonas sp. ID1715]